MYKPSGKDFAGDSKIVATDSIFVSGHVTLLKYTYI